MKRDSNYIRKLTLAVLVIAVGGLSTFFGQSASTSANNTPDAMPEPQGQQFIRAEFFFPGGSPRDFIEAMEKPFGTFQLDLSQLQLPDDLGAFLREYEEAVNEFKADWLSIADIPEVMNNVRVPSIRLTYSVLSFIPNGAGRVSNALVAYQYQADDTNGVFEERTGTLPDGTRTSASQLRTLVRNQASTAINRLAAIYDRLAEAKPELGDLVVEPPYDAPSAVMLVPDPSLERSTTKTFTFEGVPPEALASLEPQLLGLLELAGKNTEGRSILDGRTGVLIATGTESYVELVSSIVSQLSTDLFRPGNTYPAQR